MNACPLDMFHDAGDQVVFTVTDSVDLNFYTHHVFVNEHRVFDIVADNDGQDVYKRQPENRYR